MRDLLIALATLGLGAAHGERGRNALRPHHLLGNSTTHRSAKVRPAHRHVPLLVLIFSVKGNEARRDDQYRTWLTHPWRAADGASIPWRYVYVLGRSRRAAALEQPQDELVGDSVMLGRVEETYLNLVHKTLASLRWAVASVSFDVLLKTDDDSMLHVARLWAWLVSSPDAMPSPPAAPTSASAEMLPPSAGATSVVPGVSDARRAGWLRLYAGRLQVNSQVIRSNFSKADLWHPAWFPDDFRKWAVPFSSFGAPKYPPHCSGGGYLLGKSAAEAILSQYTVWRGDVFPIEDAFLGVLATQGGIRPTDMGGVPKVKQHREP